MQFNQKYVIGWSWGLFSFLPKRITYPGRGRQSGDPAVKHWRWLGIVVYWTASVLFFLSSCAQGKGAEIREDRSVDLELVQKVYRLCGNQELGPAASNTVQAHVAETLDMFSSRKDKMAFTILVCIESRFSPAVVSKAGAVGLTQVIPKYAESFAHDCYSSTKPLDVWVPEVNLKIGACQFRKLLVRYNGRYSLALAAYNAGAESPTVKKLRKGERVNQETADYISRFWNLWEALHEQELTENRTKSVEDAMRSSAPAITGRN